MSHTLYPPPYSEDQQISPFVCKQQRLLLGEAILRPPKLFRVPIQWADNRLTAAEAAERAHSSVTPPRALQEEFD
jgi:hypothetical protein